MLLEADLGNSRCKWRIIDDHGQVKEQGSCVDLAGFEGLPLDYPLSRARAVSVAPEQCSAALAEVLRREFSVELELAKPAAQLGPVKNAYPQPERLGMDRWAAVVAAYQQCHGAVMVIDAGTAVTVDLVDRSGQHLGGYIVPGEWLMKTSLYQGTEQIAAADVDADSLEFANDTDRAVMHGINAAQLGLVYLAVEQANQQVGNDFVILLCGGGAIKLNTLIQQLPVFPEVQYMPDLVLEGLQWLLP